MHSNPKTLDEAIEVICEFAREIAKLREENQRLKEQLNINSKNSSLPPSRDLKKKAPKKIKKTGKKRGGQPGHKGHHRQLVPPEAVSTTISCQPPANCPCGGSIKLSKKVTRHQVYEIPAAAYEIIEYQIGKGCCRDCSRSFHGELPKAAGTGGFGARTHAMVSLLSSRYRLSKRQVKDWFMDVYGMPMSLGSVSNMEHTVSNSLEGIYESLHAKVREEAVINMDETGFRQSNKNGWAWIMSTPTHTCFRLARSRGRKIAKDLVGDHHGHIYVTDRYSAYNWLPDNNRQVCWAHLKRDFQKISERQGEAGLIGKKLLKAYRRIFGFWKTEYDPDASPLFKKQKKRVKYFRRKMMVLLEKGAQCKHAQTARTCKNILESSESLWNFFEIKGVPPTNNHAERQLRPLVIAKKLSFGTQSDRGSRFIERIFSVVTTCRQQNKDILNLLYEAICRNSMGCRMAHLEVILVPP